MLQLPQISGRLEPHLDRMRRRASRVTSLPGLSFLSPDDSKVLSQTDLNGYLNAQRVAEAGAQEIASFIEEGWTELQATKLMETWFRDHGVRSFFHYPYAWYAERTRFQGINRQNYREFMATKRVIRRGDPFILDVAPIVDGYVSDIGYASCLGENADYSKAQEFLKSLKPLIVELFKTCSNGSDIWQQLDATIGSAGFDNIHKLYPLSVLGHRVHRVPQGQPNVRLWNFGWQSYWSLLSRGLFGQILNHEFEGDTDGIWAIEPHIATGSVGVKFEELLVKQGDDVYWLEQERGGLS